MLPSFKNAEILWKSWHIKWINETGTTLKQQANGTGSINQIISMGIWKGLNQHWAEVQDEEN